jgi:hypothetical protein
MTVAPRQLDWLVVKIGKNCCPGSEAVYGGRMRGTIATPRSSAVRAAFLFAPLMFVLCGPVFGVITLFLETPQDDVHARLDVRDQPELQSLRAENERFIQLRIWPLKLADATRIFGPKIKEPPTDMVLPLADWGGITLSGLGFGSPDNKSHTDWHAIGDAGYIDIYYQFNGDSVATAVIYARADANFVPFKNGADYTKRLEWDKAKLALMKKWLDEHLPKISDLGVVDVSPARPTVLKLGNGTNCIIRTQVLTRPGMDHDWYSLDFVLDLPGDVWEQKQPNYRSIDRPDQPVGIRFDGQFYQLTPRLIKP